MHLSNLFLTTTALSLASTLAQPLNHRHIEHELVQRDVVTVYVNADGSPVAPATEAPAAATTPATPDEPITTPTVVPSASTPIADPSAISSDVAESTPTGSTTGITFGQGVSFSAYNADGSCMSASDVAQRVAELSQYDVIRLYDTDCSQVQNVAAAIGSHQRIMAGIYYMDQIQQSVDILSTAFPGGWDQCHSVTVGNELVLNGQATPDQVVGYIQQAREALAAVGYSGPVATVDAQNVIEANPSLCEASDFVGANTQAFFSGQSSSEAGTFTTTQIGLLQSACPGKEVLITESGWPHEGSPNGQSIPSPQDETAALAAITEAVTSNLILFTAFDDPWKSPGEFGVEPYFGINY